MHAAENRNGMPAEDQASTVDAAALVASGDYASALRITHRGLGAAPRDRDLLRLKMRCLQELGQFELALVTARSLLLADPGSADASATVTELERRLTPPQLGPDEPLARPISSSLPQPFLEQLQHGLAHQTYKGRQLVKNPLDLQLYRTLIWDVRPRTIVEIGSKAGGSALFFADLLRHADIDGRVLSLDVIPVTDVDDDLVEFAFGDGRDLGPVLGAAWQDSVRRPLLVVEDADHSTTTTREVLGFFDEIMVPGDWIVVEDCNLSDVHPDRYPDGFSGPSRGLRDFLAQTENRYRVGVEYCDFYGYNWTSACNGYLERMA